MIEDGIYIGIVTNRSPTSDPVDRITISPLMEWDKNEKNWIDIDEIRRQQLFPDTGLVVYFSDDPSFLKNQVLKFKPYRNSKYIQGDPKFYSKFSVDKNNYCLLNELLILEPEVSKPDLRDKILRGAISAYKQRYNSNCLVSVGQKKWIGPLKICIDSSCNLIPIESETWDCLKVYKINDDIRIAPSYLDGRVFVDPDQGFGERVDFENWQPPLIFINHLLKRLKKTTLKKSTLPPKSGFSELQQFNQPHEDKAILLRLREYKHMSNIPKKDIDAIVEVLESMEPFQSQLKAAKQSVLDQYREDIKAKASEKKSGLENQIQILERKSIELQQKIDDQHKEIGDQHTQADQLKKSIELQQDRVNRVLIEFEHSLNQRLNQFASEPTGILVEALANDAFLQFLLGKMERSLNLGSSTKAQNKKPKFEIKQGACFKTMEEMITSYQTRLEKADLNTMLAIWIMTITLSGLTPVFKGNAVRRALNVFVNYLAYGRCFELPLSPEIISIERLFSIGQSGSVSSLGILDSAILCAATHRESLFILVLDGLDRAPSQYFLDTLLDWYSRGLMNIPSDTLFTQHIQGLQERYSLANDIVSWPSNLLLVATIKGLNDGFPVSNSALEKIIEIEADSQGNHPDIHPQTLDKISFKPAGEITANQLSEWREETLNQDIEPVNEIIDSFPKDYQQNIEIQETTRRLFAAALNLCMNLECFKEDALNNHRLKAGGLK